VVRGDQPPPARRPDLVVLTDVLVPDPRLVRTLYLERSPHLLVRVREGTGLVGPLVIPDRTSCLRCGDLQERDRDGAWPAVATQLAGRCQPADLPTAQATAAFASGQVLRVLDGLRVGGTPPPVAGHILEVDVFEGSTQRIPWPAHPECGCGAARSRPPLAQ
jgi:bacteriocin biosynthesis cyclodehydratase domain-containing protein